MTNKTPAHSDLETAETATELAAPATAAQPGNVADFQSATKMNPNDAVALYVLLGAAFVVILNETIMGVALPVLLTELGITAVTGQWLTTGFLLTMSVVIPITGTLIQRLSTRQLFFTAVGFFFTGTLIGALAPVFEILLLGRVVQAVGTAMTMPLMMTTVITVVPPAIRGQVMGRVSLVIAVAPAFGPTVSGLILQHFTWRYLFILMLPIITLLTVLAFKFLRNVGENTARKIDILSVLLSLVGFGGLVYGLNLLGEQAAHISVITFTPLLVGVLGVIAFVWRQLVLTRNATALLDLRVFNYRAYWMGAVILAFAVMGMFGAIVLLPIYAQNVLHMNTLETGLLLLPGGLFMGLMGPTVGRFVDRAGARTALLPGAILISAAMWMATGFGTDTTRWYLLVTHLVLSGGLTLVFTPVFSSALSVLPHNLVPHGSATISTLQQISGAAGVALFVTLYTLVLLNSKAAGNVELAAIADGMQAAFRLAAMLLTLLILLAFFLPNTRPAQMQQR